MRIAIIPIRCVTQLTHGRKLDTLEVAQRGHVQLGGSFVLTLVDCQIPGKIHSHARAQGSFVSSSGAASANNSAAARVVAEQAANAAQQVSTAARC